MPFSDRWTWGETLTKDEVLSLRHVHKQEVRTGYRTNLPQGTLSGEYSTTNTSPPGSANVSAVPQSVERLPTPTSLLFPSNVGSYTLNSASGAGDAARSEILEPATELSEKTSDGPQDEEEPQEDDQLMEVDEVTQSDARSAKDDAASVAADMWLDDAVTQHIPEGAQAGVSIQVEEEDDEQDAALLAAELWLEAPSPAARGAKDASEMSVAENGEDENDEDDAASLAADLWLEAEGAQSVARGAKFTAPTNEEEEAEEEDEDDVHDAASVAADAWLMGEGIHTIAGSAATSAPPSEEEEEDDEEDDVNDAASVAVDAWLMSEGTQSVARGAEFSPAIHEEGEDDDDDPASLAADVWFGAQESESGAAGADDEGEGVDPASLAAELWFLAPSAILHAEEEDEEHDDAASVAADMWFQDEPRWDAQHQAQINTSVPPQIYTAVYFPTDWIKEDEDAEHEVDVGMGDLHLVD